jgi:hypothetical protein
MGLYEYDSGRESIYMDGKQIELGIKNLLPYPMKFDAAKDFIWNWMKNCPNEYLGEQDDIDGTVKRGAWSIRNTHSWYGPLVIVKPEWAEYHK